MCISLQDAKKGHTKHDVRCATGPDFTQIHHERKRAGDSGQFSLYNTRCTWKGGFYEDVLRAGFA